MTKSYDRRIHLTPTAILAAGAVASTFRAWRNNNGLFDDRRGLRTKQVLSFAEICAVRFVQVLCDQGLVAQVACDVAMRALPEIEALLGETEAVVAEGDELSVYLTVECSRDDPRAAIRLRRHGNHLTLPDRRGGPTLHPSTHLIVNLAEIILHVWDQIEAIDAPTLATAAETHELIVGAFRRGLARRPEPETAPVAPPVDAAPAAGRTVLQ